MRADEAAVSALDAELRVPERDVARDAALLVAGGATGKCSVGGQRAHGKRIAFARHQRSGHALHEVGCAVGDELPRRVLARGARRERHRVQIRERAVHRFEVPPHDVLALHGVGLPDRLLDLLDGIRAREHAGEREEAGLQDGVDAAAEAQILRDARRVDHEELKALREQGVLHLSRQPVEDGVGCVRGVQQERGAGGGRREHVRSLEQPELVAAYELRRVHEIGGADRRVGEAQMRHGLRSRLLGVIDEVALGE